MKPFFKWVGGKRRLLPTLSKIVDELGGLPEERTYYEPFLGAGALYFHLEPKKAVLSDVNENLIGLMRLVRSSPGMLCEQVRSHEGQTYEQIREAYNRSPDPVRFFILTQTCFNGLWRENKAGLMNTPPGADSKGVRKTPIGIDMGQPYIAHKLLQTAMLHCLDFRDLIAIHPPEAGDFVYFDPPYVDQFSNYAGGGFTLTDHRDLSVVCENLGSRGVRVILSGAYNERSREIYGQPYYWTYINGTMAASALKRKPTQEAIWVYGKKGTYVQQS